MDINTDILRHKKKIGDKDMNINTDILRHKKKIGDKDMNINTDILTKGQNKVLKMIYGANIV